ncbi:thiamine diphosphokinase [Falsibacillus albus]|uniref:Thiamine diphosphokinase n=1 Tax=Falsibacillus albus TaxID=2478915 RepID=A0A3L7JYD5_9BACI|nr:thiamine diphosphokinase [Falsibacillus albus]RLQ95786.1 thiamine diphosphokinase [Falsibacillus albus]
MKINILAGGPEQFIPPLEACDKDTYWIGVDHGVYRLLSKGIHPHGAFGDFDSVSEEEWNSIQAANLKQFQVFTPEKDETDMELALNWAIEQKPSSINIFGATGGRLDHYMANAMLLSKEPFLSWPSPIEMIDRKNIISVHPAGEYSLEAINGMSYVSYIPITSEVKGITLKGFRYPLSNRHIFRGSTLCISNELIQNHGTFSFSEGILMMVRSRD